MAQETLTEQVQNPEAIAPESIAIDHENYQVVLGDAVIAEISYDDCSFETQRWVVKMDGEEAYRNTTVARCESWVLWHYKQGTLPVHHEWYTVQSEVLDHLEEQAEEVAPELPATEVKVARELKVGDEVVLDGGTIYRIERINRRLVEYQVGHSEVHGVRFHLTLLPEDYQYRPFQGEPTDYEAARQHEFRESDRFVDTAKYLVPCGEVEFDVVMKAVLPMPDTTNLIGYDFCLANNIQFKQRTGKSGTIYWYGVAPHYYGQPGRQYKTTGFPELKKTIKATIEYFDKCNTRGAAEIKQQLNEEVDTLAPQEKSATSEPSRLIKAVKELVPVAFALVLTIGVAGHAIAAKKPPIQPKRNPDALKEQLSVTDF